MARVWFYFRFHHEAMRDEKIRSLTPAQRWLWVAVLTAASKSPVRGYLLISGPRSITDKELADLANLPVREVTRTLPLLAQEGMIRWDDGLSCWSVTNWDKRQFESDNSTERVRKHRDVKRSTTVTGNVTGPLDETPLELRVKSKEVLTTSPPPLTVVGTSDRAAAAFVAEVVETVAQRQLAATKTRKQVDSESGWLTIARRNLTAIHTEAIIQAHAFGQTAPEVADLLEPPPQPGVPHPQSTRTAKCATCNDRPGAYDMDAAGNAIRCPDCSAKETA